jgi:hypothetical protein
MEQFTSGLRQVAEVVGQYPCFDVFSTDNTVEHPEQIDARIAAALDTIPTLMGKYHFWDNQLGQFNQGSGMVAAWSRAVPDLLGRYEYLVHYEPRQHLVNFSFFERMARQPDAYFCVYHDKRNLYGIPLTMPRFWTGFFSMRPADLCAYAFAKDRGVPPPITPRPWWWERYRQLRFRYLPGWLERLDECIEADLFRYVRRHRIPFVPVPALGTRWHDQANDLWVDMDDRDR